MLINWTKQKTGNESDFQRFFQKMANRLIHGHIQYGDIDRSKSYLTRLKKEIKSYEKTGNLEHLYNVANYCILESIAPENPLFHEDNNVGSVTRRRSSF